MSYFERSQRIDQINHLFVIRDIVTTVVLYGFQTTYLEYRCIV